MLTELNEKLRNVSQIFNRIGYDKITKLIILNQPISETKLPYGFIKAIKAAAKLWIKLE